jgi:hypothetical protein
MNKEGTEEKGVYARVLYVERKSINKDSLK